MAELRRLDAASRAERAAETEPVTISPQWTTSLALVRDGKLEWCMDTSPELAQNLGVPATPIPASCSETFQSPTSRCDFPEGTVYGYPLPYPTDSAARCAELQGKFIPLP